MKLPKLSINCLPVISFAIGVLGLVGLYFNANILRAFDNGIAINSITAAGFIILSLSVFLKGILVNELVSSVIAVNLLRLYDYVNKSQGTIEQILGTSNQTPVAPSTSVMMIAFGIAIIAKEKHVASFFGLAIAILKLIGCVYQTENTFFAGMSLNTAIAGIFLALYLILTPKKKSTR